MYDITIFCNSLYAYFMNNLLPYKDNNNWNSLIVTLQVDYEAFKETELFNSKI